MSHVKLNRKAIEEVTSLHGIEERKACIRAKVGDTSGLDLFFNRILVAAYVRGGTTKGGIILTDTYKEEDIWQGKVGLVIKVGRDAFKDDDTTTFNGQKADVGQWVVFKTGDGYQTTVGDWPCRILRDSSIIGTLKDPSIIDKD